MKFLIIISLLLSLKAFAAYENPQEVLELSPEETNPSMDQVILKKPEKYQHHESIISDLNSSIGVKDKRQYTGRDVYHFSFGYHGAARIGEIQKLTSFEVNLLKRSKNYSQIWWGAMLKMTKAPFSMIADNQPASTGDDTNDESKYQRPDSASSNITTLGYGAGYRFKLLLDFMKTKDVFEQINVYGTYNQWKESYIGKTYKGYGVTADYLLEKRSSTNFFYGLKYSYNFALMERSAIGTEKARDRSLVLSYSSLAFQLGYLFE